MIGALLGMIGGSIASSVIGGGIQSSAIKRAGKVGEKALRQGATFNFFAGKQAESALEPFYNAAVEGIPYTMDAAQKYSEMSQAGPGRFEDSGYFNAMNLGIDRAAREMGTASTATGQGYGRNLMKYATNLAGEKFGQHQGEWVNRLNALRGQPQPYPSAPINTAKIRQDMGRDMYQATRDIGGVQSDAALGQGSAWMNAMSGISGAIGNAGGMYAMNSMMNPQQPQQQPPGGGSVNFGNNSGGIGLGYYK